MSRGRQTLPEGGSPILHRIGQWISVVFVRLPFRVRMHHRERVPRTGGVVMVANHSSNADGLLLYGMVPRTAVFLIKYELFRGPLGWFLRRIGQLPVRRGEVDRTPLMAAVKILRAGGLVGVFPEGTRANGGRVESAQHGAAWLARTAGAQLVPVACRGTRRPDGARRRFLPEVDVLFGHPVTLPDTKGRQGLDAATEQVRTELLELLAQLDGAPDRRDRPDETRGMQA